jgi:predicted kinase
MSTGVLIALAGLPGTGKSSMARELARRHGAMHLRIDTIEQALKRAASISGKIGPEGYAVAYALAEDHLRLGQVVIADSVNPLAITRDAWRDAATRAGAVIIEVEVCCSDSVEHRRRIESRIADIAGLVLPTWQDVQDRAYESWNRERVIIDTAGLSVEACVDLLDKPLRVAMSAR